MADIELVIKIDEDIAQGIIKGNNDEPRNIVRSFQATIADAIKNGTPLPKGHGDLIDVNRKITVPIYDEEYEEWGEEILTVREAINKWSDEGITIKDVVVSTDGLDWEEFLEEASHGVNNDYEKDI